MQIWTALSCSSDLCKSGQRAVTALRCAHGTMTRDNSFEREHSVYLLWALSSRERERERERERVSARYPRDTHENAHANRRQR